MGLTWKDKLVGPLLTWQTIHCLQKEWAGGFSVFWASARVSWERSAGLAARMCTDWGSRHGGSGHQTRKRKRRSFTPRPTLVLVTALLWPPAWPWRPLGDCDVRFWFFNRIWGFSGCQRTLNLRGKPCMGLPGDKGSAWIIPSSLPRCEGSSQLIIMKFVKSALSITRAFLQEYETTLMFPIKKENKNKALRFLTLELVSYTSLLQCLATLVYLPFY